MASEGRAGMEYDWNKCLPTFISLTVCCEFFHDLKGEKKGVLLGLSILYNSVFHNLF